MTKTPAVPRVVSIATMLRSFERTLRAEGKSERTVDAYATSVRMLSAFLSEKDRELTVDVTREEIRDFITEQATRRKLPNGRMGGSPATALVRFKSLQQFFKHCVEEEELEVSPMAGMRAPKVEVVPVPVVPDDVLERLVKVRSGKTLEHRRDAAILRVFLDTGCRKSEVANLRVSDVNLDNQTIQVLGKGNKLRHVPFGINTSQALERYLRLFGREHPETAEDSDRWLWMGRQGKLSTSGIDDILHRMCDQAGVPRLHWHQLRHTFAHEWLARGGNEGDLMSLAGWQSRSMLDRYAKSAQVERAHAASRRMSLGDRI